MIYFVYKLNFTIILIMEHLFNDEKTHHIFPYNYKTKIIKKYKYKEC